MGDSMIREGSVLVHARGADDKPLFYNPPQVFNRDLSLLVLRAFITQEKEKTESNPKLGRFVGVNILEALAATGIRGMRYLRELGDLVNLVTFNDLDRNSAEMIVRNAELNEIPRSRFRVTCCDGNLLAYILTPQPDVAKFFQMAGNFFKIPAGAMNQFTDVLGEFNGTVDALLKAVSVSDLELGAGGEGAEAARRAYRNIVDVVDLDPYSSATGFVDSAVRAVKSGGVVLITSTDMPTLCGNNPLVSFYKYGGASFKAPFCHELSLRVLLYSVMLTASRYKRVVHPLLSVSVDFYVRLFVQVRYSPEGCKKVAGNSGLVFLCVKCHSYRVEKMCGDFLVHPPEAHQGEGPEGVVREGGEANGAGPLGEASVGPDSSDTGSQITRNGNSDANGQLNRTRRRKKARVGVESNLSKTCEECGSRMKMGGPLYIGPLHDKPFVQRCLEMSAGSPTTLSRGGGEGSCGAEAPEGGGENGGAAAVSPGDETANVDGGAPEGISMGKRIRGLLLAVSEVPCTLTNAQELDVPLFYSASDLCQVWNLSTISPIVFRLVRLINAGRRALQNMGYRASSFHRDPNSIKTDAPNHVVMDIVRTHAKNSEKVAGHAFFERQIDTIGIDLDLKIHRVKQEPRWVPNPTSHWGPKKRHRTTSYSIRT